MGFKGVMSRKTILSFLLLISYWLSGCNSEDIKESQKENIDPLFKYQWYIKNTSQYAGAKAPATFGEDINVTTVWNDYQGRGIRIAIVDTGIEKEHYDLSSNIDTKNSYRYIDKTNDPSPTEKQKRNFISGAHGTACAGIIAAIKDNAIGITGIAPKAKLVSLNVFSSNESEDFADALYNKNRDIDISSNSWGDSVGSLDDESLELIAIKDGATNGRDGKGIIYIFAGGNQRYKYSTNYFRELNNPFVITVAALNSDGKYASYSNTGSNILISAYGGEFGVDFPAIVTTDLMGDYGYDSVLIKHFQAVGNELNAFTNIMNGTSAATPMVAATIALMLEANPNLTYRDVKYILAHSARKNDPNNSNWKQNGAGLWYNLNYGFGVVDAGSAINLAKNFTSLSKQKTFEQKILTNKNIEIGIYNDEFEITEDLTIEHVEINITLYHESSNDISITLTSPDGSSSKLAYPLDSNDSLPRNFFVNRTLSSVHFMDEKSKGKWKISINDVVPNNQTGVLEDLSIKIYGR